MDAPQPCVCVGRERRRRVRQRVRSGARGSAGHACRFRITMCCAASWNRLQGDVWLTVRGVAAVAAECRLNAQRNLNSPPRKSEPALRCAAARARAHGPQGLPLPPLQRRSRLRRFLSSSLTRPPTVRGWLPLRSNLVKSVHQSGSCARAASRAEPPSPAQSPSEASRKGTSALSASSTSGRAAASASRSHARLRAGGSSTSATAPGWWAAR